MTRLVNLTEEEFVYLTESTQQRWFTKDKGVKQFDRYIFQDPEGEEVELFVLEIFTDEQIPLKSGWSLLLMDSNKDVYYPGKNKEQV